MSASAFATALEAALWWTEQSFSPVPVPIRSKAPVLSGWPNLRITSANVAEYFNGAAQNVGLLLGLNDAADCDLDTPQAISVAPAFLPITGIIFGRASKPRSHWIYRSPGLRAKKFLDPTKSNSILELRGLKTDGSIGLQTVVPPGVHESGEAIEFVEQGAPTVVAPDVLTAAAAKIAAAALLAKYWPAHGRHDAMLALAGVLARAGWSITDAKKFCHALYGAVATHDPNAVGRSDSEVASTYEKHAAGQQVTGFPKLAEVINYRVLATALDWLGMQPPDWRTGLICGKTGPKPVLANACAALRSAPEWAGVPAFDQFALRAVAIAPTPWGKTGTWDNTDDLRVCEWLHHQGILVSSKVAAEAVQVVAGEHGFHPVKQYLESVEWDGMERLPFWLTVCFGAPDDEYTRAIATRWPISAIARVLRPGCQADHCLLLLGLQGILKSSGTRLFTGDQWYSDHLSDLGSKDSRIEMLGRWIIEFGELSNVSRGELEGVKAFITCRVDVFRPPYGRRAEAVPRQTIFCATANNSEILTDPTGNRRFWPVDCTKVDLDAIRNCRDLLWAEALFRYRRGDPWWLESAELTALAEVEQAKHYEPGPRDELILDWIKQPTPQEKVHSWDDELPWCGSKVGRISIQDVLVHCFRIPVAQLKPSDAREVGRCLRHLGWRVGVQEAAGPYRGKRFCVSPEPPEARPF